MQRLEIRRPDDWHIHLRDGHYLASTCRDAGRYFGRAIIMPNLTPPVMNVEQALAYRARINAAQDANPRQFEPLMVLYLTDKTTPADIAAAAAHPFVHAAKLYPAGATTNSDSGVTDLKNIGDTLAAMEEHQFPLLVHGEVTTSHVDIFDREKAFIDQQLSWILGTYPRIKMVLEHITTADAVEFVSAAGPNVGATITAHHLLYNRNHMLAGGIRPHFYCLPILKRNTHQAALIKAATSGNPKFFLGTDSAPHATHRKETGCGCAGCYTAYAAIELYAEAFEAAGALDKLEGFASDFGADFYGLPRHEDRIVLARQTWTAPDTIDFGGEHLTPLRAGETLQWRVIA
ncbi:MAG TPA: dihydroorotase [Pseudomonadales bacterium]|nr:dihydroorotase [Pseudomonadales bacterium]